MHRLTDQGTRPGVPPARLCIRWRHAPHRHGGPSPIGGADARRGRRAGAPSSVRGLCRAPRLASRAVPGGQRPCKGAGGKRRGLRDKAWPRRSRPPRLPGPASRRQAVAGNRGPGAAAWRNPPPTHSPGAQEHSALPPRPLPPCASATGSQVRAARPCRLPLDTNRSSVPAHLAGHALTLHTSPDRRGLSLGAHRLARHGSRYDRSGACEAPDPPQPRRAPRKKAREPQRFLRFLALSPRAEA